MTICQRCQADIPEGQLVAVRGKSRRELPTILCASCAAGIEQQLQDETKNPNLLLAALSGLAAAAAGILIWYGVSVLNHSPLGFVAAGVGWLVGMGVVFGAGRKRGPALQAISVIITLAALVIGEYLIVHHFAAQTLARQGFTGLALILPPALMLELLITEVQEDLLILVFGAIALWAAFSTPARRHLHRLDRV